MRLADNECPGNRPYNPHHPTCHTCTIPCISKTASKPSSCLPETRMGESAGKKAKGPNKTEASYMAALGFEYPHGVIKFEQVTFHLDNGHAYTPDIVVWGDWFDGGALFVEVKNAAYKHASYGRSRIAFDQCRLEHSEFQWRWAEKTKEGWTVKHY